MQLILKYFPGLNQDQVEKFQALDEIYGFWNQKINVISRKDISFLRVRHILHSLSLAKICNFKAGTTFLDAGTGGGFPGIPMAIYFPDCKFHLVDSVNKKIKVINEVVKSLNLLNVKTDHGRVEDLKTSYDFVVGRSVTSFPVFLSWVKGKIYQTSGNYIQNGILYLKGGNFENEIMEFREQINLYNINEFYDEAYFKTKKIIHYIP
ncbi:16S rRNA (guanine(527)-N(7))-methyltransferase RsmG [Bacteroidota bacterium]